MDGPIQPDVDGALVVSSTRAAWLATHGNHPNLVGILGVHHVAAGPRLMIEHVAGRDLDALMEAATPGRIGLGEALAIVRDLARGLHFLHELRNDKGTAVRMVHGTLAPELVVVGYDGIARVSGLERLAATRGAPWPRPEFAAPEQLVAGAAVDRRADVFALGAVLLRAATGLYVVDGAIPVPTSQAVPHVSQQLEDVLRRALAREPSKRYGTAEELRGALEGVAVREGLMVMPDRVAMMVTRLLPEIAPAAAAVAPPPRPDQSLWAGGAKPGPPRWLATDTVVEQAPAANSSPFDVVSVAVPRPRTMAPSPLVPATNAAAPTMAVPALADSGPVRRATPVPSRTPFANPPVQAPMGAMELPLHLAMPLAAMMISPAPRYEQPVMTDRVRLADPPRRRSIVNDPIFLIGVGILLFFGALVIAYVATG